MSMDVWKNPLLYSPLRLTSGDKKWIHLLRTIFHKRSESLQATMKGVPFSHAHKNTFSANIVKKLKWIDLLF